jgi:non-ribosomal peptide synthetase component F
LRTDLSGNPGYLQVLERVKQTVLGAFANQEYPFDLIIWDQQQGTHRALYSVVFILQNASKISLTFDNITMQASFSERLADGGEEVFEGFGDDFAAQYDLHIEAFEVNGQILLATQYDSQHFSAETVDRWLAQFVSVLDQFTFYPDRRLSQLTLFDPDELDDLFASEEGGMV